MKHYVRQQVTKGTSYRTIEDYSAKSIKDIVLFQIQSEFKKAYSELRYTISKTQENLLNNQLFYRTGLTYKQIKDLAEEDVEDLCMMITTDLDRDSLTYMRICPYLHKSPINISELLSNDKYLNKKITPIKIKTIPEHLLRFCLIFYKKVKDNTYTIKPELANAYNLVQYPFQTRDEVYNHIKNKLIEYGLNLTNIVYQKIPKPVYVVMMIHSSYFKGDSRTSYHKSFSTFFSDYFKNTSQLNLSAIDLNVSPFLASYLDLDINKTYSRAHLISQINKTEYWKTRNQLIYTSKKDYISQKIVRAEDIVNSHTYITTTTTTNILSQAGLNIKHHPLNVYKSGLILQRFYRTKVKSSPQEVVKVAPESPKSVNTTISESLSTDSSTE